ncbi:DUF3019 domain-containing protein [Alteromonadaceae bacterium BrNp21-10]|nr:DUF3019 domain-containing protein [Alteromonadaceae bacterium BrNp21-10]
MRLTKKEFAFNAINKLLLITALLIGFITHSHATTTRLSIMPQQCVSLYQGQSCYSQVKVTWQSGEKNDYCLYIENQSQPLKCWHNVTTGMLLHELNTSHNIRFILQVKGQRIDIADSELTVSWVYQKKQKSRLTWRLF